MTVLTGQEILKVAIKRAGGAAALVKAAKLRRHSDAEGFDHQVRGWASGKTKKGPPADVVIYALDYLGAINWEVLEREPPASAERLRAPTTQAKQKTAQARKRAGGGTP